MENASKAIVIAGSILVAVMLVSLGVFVFNIAKSPVERFTGTIEELANVAANSVFLQYIGNDKKATSVQALLDQISVNNSNSSSPTTIEVTTVAGGNFSPTKAKVSKAADIMNLRNEISTKDTLYDIKVTEVDGSGVIASIEIKGKAN